MLLPDASVAVEGPGYPWLPAHSFGGVDEPLPFAPGCHAVPVPFRVFLHGTIRLLPLFGDDLEF